jgi:hypothetical protein
MATEICLTAQHDASPERKEMSEKCFYCDKPATHFCDYKIGGPIGGYERVGPIEKCTFRACFTIQPFYTCDMPMCDEHKTFVGTFHASGKESWSETIDHCPEHAHGKPEDPYPITEEEAEAIRRDIRAKVRRRQIMALDAARATPPAEQKG